MGFAGSKCAKTTKEGFMGHPVHCCFSNWVQINQQAGLRSRVNNRGHGGACEGSTYGLNTFLLVTLIGNLQNTTPPIPLSFFGQNDVQLRGRVVPPNSAKKESAKKNQCHILPLLWKTYLIFFQNLLIFSRCWYLYPQH